MFSEIEVVDGLEVDERLEEYYVSCFSNEVFPIDLKVRMISWLIQNYCLSQTQYSKLCLAICHQVNWRMSVSLQDFSCLLDLFLFGSSIPTDSREQLTDDQKSEVIDALKGSIKFPDLFEIYSDDDGIPHIKYLDPYLQKLEKVVEY